MTPLAWRLRRARRVLSGRYPRTALRTAGALARARCVYGLGAPAPALVLAALDAVLPNAGKGVAAAIASSDMRVKALGHIASTRGLNGIVPLLGDTRPLSAVLAHHPRAVLVTFHVGPAIAIVAALVREGIRALLVKRQVTFGVPDNWQVRPTLDDSSRAAAALLRAVLWLRDPGMVLIAADGGPQSVKLDPLPCLRRNLRLSRGPFFLARRARVPVIPVVGCWGEGMTDLRVEVGEPVDATAGSDVEAEHAMARRCLQWLDQYLRQRPDHLSLAFLTALAHAPRSASAEDVQRTDSFRPAAQHASGLVERSAGQQLS